MIDIQNIANVGPEPLGDNDIYHVPYERTLVNLVDKIVDKAKKDGCGKEVKREKDWEMIEYLFTVWSKLYPEKYHIFKEDMLKQKVLQKNRTASNREGEAQLQHQLDLPRKLHDMIQAVFPLQKFDKKFTAKLSRKMPILKIPDAKL